MTVRGPIAAALRRAGDDVAPYLWMLNLAGDDGIRAVAFMRGILAAGVDDGDALELLSDSNWRPNLVAAFAVAVGLRSAAVTDGLWRALERGSWVSPQLAAAAFVADGQFLARAEERLAAREGGAPAAVDAKAAGALLALCQRAAPRPLWVARRAADATWAAFVATAVDDGGALAEAWYLRVPELLAGA